MTGRLHVAAELVDFIELFGVSGELAGMHPMPPRHNVAPTEPVLTIVDEYGRRTARLMKWAFVPDWVKDPREFSRRLRRRAGKRLKRSRLSRMRFAIGAALFL
nr:SOS response-associated peptidase family protein [uncultured Cohaesibacter sp.]